MPQYHPSIPAPPDPTRVFFDPFNSSSTGHQRAENRLAGSTSWRDSRSFKLSHQFNDQSGSGGDHHIVNFSITADESLAKNARNIYQREIHKDENHDIRKLMGGTRKRTNEETDDKTSTMDKKQKQVMYDDRITTAPDAVGNSVMSESQAQKMKSKEDIGRPQIFRGLTVYLNGSTAPLVSDHKLKQMFVQHGGHSSLALGRRTVTHVILGDTCGGGLASRKIDKEVTTIGGKGIKYVTAHWVLDSIEKGTKQPEGHYMPQNLANRIGGHGQKSVSTIFGSKK